MFQRRHFEAIASEVMTWDKTETKAQIVLNLVAFFIHYNPNFNEDRFVKACEAFEGELI
tara:strand:+ start:1047 stop:1223 length:177 start_codon:yes stop_codon:yes gene_type:complete